MLNLSNCLDNCPLICLPSAFNSEKEKQWFGAGLRSFTEKAVFVLPLATGGNSQPNPLLLELVSLEGSERRGVRPLDWWMGETWMQRGWFARGIWSSARDAFCRKHISMDWLKAVYEQLFFPPSFVTLHSTCVAVIICFCKVFFLPCPCPLLMADHTENRCDAGFSGWLWTDGRTQWMGEQRSGRTYISTDTLLVCVCSWNPFSLKLLENRLRGV